MTDLERQIAERFPTDPRTDAQAKQALASLWDDDAGDGTLGAAGGFASDDEMEAAAALLVNDLKEASDFGLAHAPKDEPVVETPPVGEPAGTVEAHTPIETYDQLIEVLGKYDITDEEALGLILEGNRELAKSAEEDLWRREVEQSGFTEQEVYEAISEYLSRGYISLRGSIQKGGHSLDYILTSRSSDDEDRVQHALMSLMSSDANVTERLVTKTAFCWKIAGSLSQLRGFGVNMLRGHTAGHSDIESIAKWVSSLNTLTFELLCKLVNKLDTLNYLACQRIAIENF